MTLKGSFLLLQFVAGKEVENVHYGEFKDTKDKIIHVLYAADFEGLYEKAKKECVQEWGNEAVLAINIYEKDYKN